MLTYFNPDSIRDLCLELKINVTETIDPWRVYADGKDFTGRIYLPDWVMYDRDPEALAAAVLRSGVEAARKYEALHGPPPGRDG